MNIVRKVYRRFPEGLLRDLFRVSTFIIGQEVPPVPLSSVRLGQSVPSTSVQRTLCIGILDAYRHHRFPGSKRRNLHHCAWSSVRGVPRSSVRPVSQTGAAQVIRASADTRGGYSFWLPVGFCDRILKTCVSESFTARRRWSHKALNLRNSELI